MATLNANDRGIVLNYEASSSTINFLDLEISATWSLRHISSLRTGMAISQWTVAIIASDDAVVMPRSRDREHILRALLVLRGFPGR